jgi:hypothetical protein
VRRPGARGISIPPRWRLADALAAHQGLSLVPGSDTETRIAGELRARGFGLSGALIDEQYEVDVRIPASFPRHLPVVYETGHRISRSFHHLAGDSLCLGSPTAQKLAIESKPTIGGFIDRVVVPYLFGHAHYTRFGTMPFGELGHGAAGLEQDIRRLFRLPFGSRADEFLRLAGMRRRHANKQPCHCGSGVRVGRCHGVVVHSARRRLGREWCREQLLHLRLQRDSEGGADPQSVIGST